MKESDEDGFSFAEALKIKHDRESAKNLLAWAREGLSSNERRFHRLEVTMLFLALGFELCARSSITSVKVGPVEINDLSLPMKILTVVFAVCAYNCHLAFCMTKLHGHVFYAVLPQAYSSIRHHGLESFGLPPSPRINGNIIAYYGKGRITGAINVLVILPNYLAIFVLPVAFEVYAFILCFMRFGLCDPVLWGCLIGTLIFLVATVLVIIQTTRIINIPTSLSRVATSEKGQ